MPANRSTRDQLISQLEYAIVREKYSQTRYLEAASLARNEKVRLLLEALANEEKQHEWKLRDILDRLRAAPDPKARGQAR